MVCIVCRCDVADWIPKIGYENMALLPERAAWSESCNATKPWLGGTVTAQNHGKLFPQQLSRPTRPAEGMHTSGGRLCLRETSLEVYINISDPLH
jgi:hypothetical protein